MLRVCLFHKESSAKGREGDGAPFSAAFEGLTGVSIVGICDTAPRLREIIAGGCTDVVAVDLDDRAGLETVEQIAADGRDIGVVGISGNADASFIIKAMRAGCGQFVCKPIDPDDLRNALHRVRPAQTATTEACKRICVIGSSGGAGATTVACNLAPELCQFSGRPTALVDMNLEYGDVACAFDCTPKYSIADVCGVGVVPDEDMLSAALHALPCGISVLARPDHIEESREVSPEGVSRVFEMLGESFSYVVVDLPRVYNFLSVAAVSQCDHVLVVSQMGVPSVRNATRIIQTLSQMGADEDSVHIVLNRCNADHERLTIRDVEAHFKRPVFGIIPNDYRPVMASLDLGRPLGTDSPTSPARTAIREIAAKLAGRDGESATVNKAGLFGKLFGRAGKK